MIDEGLFKTDGCFTDGDGLSSGLLILSSTTSWEVDWAVEPFKKASTVIFGWIFGLSSTLKLAIKTGNFSLVGLKGSTVDIEPDVTDSLLFNVTALTSTGVKID